MVVCGFFAMLFVVEICSQVNVVCLWGREGAAESGALPGSDRFGSVLLGSVRFDSVRFGSVLFGSVRLFPACSVCYVLFIMVGEV